ncbi:MAG: cupin domain-containing protein, partial [Pseudomonadota bacterium]
VLRPHASGGATIFLRFAKGAVGAPHTHPGGEELFVVSGDISIGGKRVVAGDYLYTPPDAVHDAVAHEDTVLLLSLPKLPVFI